jgi:hypothetical protein
MLALKSEVRSFAASPDGNLLTIALNDGRVVIWPCLLCGDIEKVIALGYSRVAPLIAQLRLQRLQETPEQVEGAASKPILAPDDGGAGVERSELPGKRQ